VGPRVRWPGARGAGGAADDPADVHMGDVPPQPRRGGPVGTERERAGRMLRGLRPRGVDAALRPRDPPTAGADARRRPTSARVGVRHPVLIAWDTGAAL